MNKMRLLLPSAVLALYGAASAAPAAPCPTGQIFRVSKHVCMDRAEAVKLGIVHGAVKPKPAAEARQPAPQPASQPAPEVATAPPAPPAPPPVEPAEPPASPYGVLDPTNIPRATAM